MPDLRCTCTKYNDKIAEYDDNEVRIKCRHGKIMVLRVVEGKLKEVSNSTDIPLKKCPQCGKELKGEELFGISGLLPIYVRAYCTNVKCRYVI